MLRTFLTGLTVAVTTILLAPLAVLGTLLGLNTGRWSVPQLCMRAWARAACAAAGVHVVVHGREHMAQGRGSIYASNHVSWFDIFAIASVLPRYTFVAKSELRKIPIFGWGAEGAGVIFLARENRKSAFEAYRGAATQVEEGQCVVVCPEGTRGHDYHLRPFKKGPFVLAIAAKAPVIPIVVYGAREVMAKAGWRITPGTVHVHLLPAVESAGFDYEHRHELMRAVWTGMADLMRREYGVGTNELPVASAAEELSA
jgi:1-acyl-sn-glycerol-3-phosphate acyltransferase